MQYRRFGKLDWEVSALGFGCMRLPSHDGQHFSAAIDEPEAIRMLRHAIDQGVNYVDTAYPYHDGNSELVLGKALRDGYRERVRVATKLPVWLVQEPADFDRLLNEQLSKLGTDHIDFYLFHALNRSRWTEIVLKHGLLARADAAVRDGRIGHVGFSIHDAYGAFEEIVDGYDWSFCQIQYNYMDIENQVGTKGLELAGRKGLGVVVMEPLLGGRLANPPADVRAGMEAFPVRRTPAEWALEWLWNQPQVSVVLSGMSAMEQVEQNLQAADRSTVGAFGEAEQAVIAAARDLYRARTVIPCTNCEYCMPCPTGVDIPGNFALFNHTHLFDDLPISRIRYQRFYTEPQRAGACLACDECASKCPQQIPISDWMPKVHALLGG